MTLWEWIGTGIITGLSGGMGVYSLKWLRECMDRKARKISYHSKALLEQADNMCGTARAMQALADGGPGSHHYEQQASVLWTTTSTSSLLNVWLANAWVLDPRKKLRALRESFVTSVDKLRQAAIAWHDADMRWRQAGAFPAFRTYIGGSEAPSPEGQAKQDCASAYREAFEAFIIVFQALHNTLQKKVREYMSAPEGLPDQTQQ